MFIRNKSHINKGMKHMNVVKLALFMIMGMVLSSSLVMATGQYRFIDITTTSGAYPQIENEGVKSVNYNAMLTKDECTTPLIGEFEGLDRETQWDNVDSWELVHSTGNCEIIESDNHFVKWQCWLSDSFKCDDPNFGSSNIRLQVRATFDSQPCIVETVGTSQRITHGIKHCSNWFIDNLGRDDFDRDLIYVCSNGNLLIDDDCGSRGGSCGTSFSSSECSIEKPPEDIDVDIDDDSVVPSVVFQVVSNITDKTVNIIDLIIDFFARLF